MNLESKTTPVKVIAIDGPSGAGKSSVAFRVAKALDLPYLDTGAMYRAVGWMALSEGVRVPLPEDFDGSALARKCAELIRLETSDKGMRVWLGSEEISTEIRSPEASVMASAISVLPEVRRVLVRRQRIMGESSGGVMEGRDIGTVVFPDAVLKVFLTASPKTRARRRLSQRGAQGTLEELAEILREQKERDQRDSTREDSPLQQAGDAVFLDSTEMSVDEVVERIVSLFEKALSRISGSSGIIQSK